MQKSGILFVIVGSIVGVGIILSFYGNQVIFEDLNKVEGQVKFGENLIIPVELDNTETQTGIYAVQIINFKEGITAKILDPFDKEIESQLIDKEVFEGRFNIAVSGIYKLVIENTDKKEIKIFGMVGVAIYAIKNRKKSFS